MRIVLVGSVESSVVALRALLEADMAPKLVVTLPQSSASRHSDFVDLGGIAASSGLPVYYSNNINAVETLEAVKSANPDLCLVIGWSQICGHKFRSIARLGNLGFHPAPLPRLRGRAVIPWTILKGESTTASTLFWLDEGMDSGDILLQKSFSVESTETARTLYNKHTGNIASMVPEAVNLCQTGTPPRYPQDHSNASYCAKRTPADGLINWNDSAETILRLIRAVGDPYPGAFTYFGEQCLKIDAASIHPNPRRFIGFAGQVQVIEDNNLIVMCGDENCIVISKWRSETGIRPGVHQRLCSNRYK